MNLPPVAPPGVRYVLTVPQSVLFTELSFQGNLRRSFFATMGIDYEPDYIVYDSGGISWNVNDAKLTRALCAQGSVSEAIQKFVAAMESTARVVDKTSRMVTSAANRRSGVVDDLIEDLEQYWLAYKLHMTSLFAFWSVESLLAVTLKDALTEVAQGAELNNWLTACLQPFERNYFALESQQLDKIARRFLPTLTECEGRTALPSPLPPALLAALKNHGAVFGFILEPFNIGKPPSAESLVERLTGRANEQSGSASAVPEMPIGAAPLDKLPTPVRQLGLLAQRLAFWKTERLDVCWLADARAKTLYVEASNRVGLTPDELMTMTSVEILSSLRRGALVVDKSTLRERQEGYCLVLHNGNVAFYQRSGQRPPKQQAPPARCGTVINGDGASPGRVTGRAKVIHDGREWADVQSGEILVATMTRPEMGAALDRAAAFVTDEGGLLCHAAVIARQFGKPAVVATDNATEVIRTGMILTVDGSNGTVHIDEVLS